MALAGKRANVKVSGDSVIFENESVLNLDDKNYQIEDVNKRVFDRKAEISVYVDEVITGESYSVNRLRGIIEFDDEDSERGEVTLDGEYLPMSKAGGANEYDYTIEADNLEATEFQSDWITRVQGLLDISGSLSIWYDLDDYFADALMDESVVVIEFYSSDNVEPDLKCWAVLDSDEMSVAVDGLVEQSVDFEGTSDIDKRVVSI